MKVYKPTSRLIDIGPLDVVLRVTSAIGKVGMRTCGRCKKKISDNVIAVGFLKGHANLILHEDCLDEQAKSVITNPDEKIDSCNAL